MRWSSLEPAWIVAAVLAVLLPRSCGISSSIARSVLHQIGEDHRIVGYAQEASTSHGPSIRPPVSSTPTRMQPIRGKGRGRRRGGVDRRGRARDGGPGHGPDSDNGLGTLEPTLPTSIPSHTYPSPEMFIHPHTCTSPSIPHTLTHHLPYPHTLAHHLPYSHTLTRLYLIRCRQSQHP